MLKRTSQLQIRMTASFVLSTVLPLLIVGAVFALAFINLSSQAIQARQESIVQIGRVYISRYFSSALKEMTLLGSFVDQENPAWLASVETVCKKSAEPYLLLSMVNLNGQEIARLENCKAADAATLVNRSTEEAFFRAKLGETFVRNVGFDGFGNPIAVFSLRTQAESGEDVVIISQTNIANIWQPLNELNIGDGGYIYVVDQRGNLIGYRDPALVQQEKNLSALPSVKPLLVNHPGVTGSRYVGLLGEEVIGTSIRLEELGWGLVLEQNVDQAYRAYNSLVIALVIALLFFSGLAVALALYLSQGIVVPIRKLAEGAQAIGQGNLNAYVEVTSKDEIGITAAAFNQMTSQLRQTLDGLEEKIQERTQDLEKAQMQSERRAEALGSITEISRAISTEQDINRLMNQVSELVSEKFHFYHVGIFLIDDLRRYAILQAANSEGGKRMLVRNHKLEVGQLGLVGYVSQYGRARIALDVGKDSVFFNNPDLPLTHSEMALPLRVRGTTIGVLDVQSEQPNAFGDADTSILSVLADQVAIAIENARLFGQAQKALAEAQSLYDQYLGQQWKKTIQEENKFIYQQSTLGGQSLDKAIQSPEIQRALKKGEMIIFKSEATQEEQLSTIVMPVKLRNQIIGVLNIKSPSKDHTWSQDQINMVKLISERLALTLETARLFNESQRRAAKEQIIGEISSKISASFNMRSVLQTTAEELGRALPGSEVLIQFTDQDKK